MKALGLDLGGTYVKAAWLRGGRAHEVQRRQMPDFISTSGQARELDPDALLDVVHELLDSYPGAESVWIAGQMSCFTFVGGDSKALLPLISWQDERVSHTQPLADRLGPAVLNALGNELRPGLPIATLCLTNAVPADVRTEGNFTSLMGFVAGSLVGRWAETAHVTDAAASGMWDLTVDQWNGEAVSLAGLRPNQLPTGTWSFKPIGRTSNGALVHTPLGDQQASLHGSGLRSGVLSMNIATGGQASVIGSRSEVPADVQLRPFLNGRYLHTITHLPAGRALTTVVRLLSHGDTSISAWEWARAACSLEQLTGHSEVRSPSWNLGFFSGDGGTLSGLTGAATAEDCMAAAVDQLAQGFIAAAKRLEDKELLIFSGGLAQKFEPLRRLIIGALDIPAHVHDGDDATLDGLALIAQEYSEQ